MHSLFSRSRTTSTPKRPETDAAFDEFGRVTSRGSGKVPSASTSKKDKKSKDKSRKASSAQGEPEVPEYTVPDGSFLSFNLDPQRYEPGEGPSPERRQLVDYGYLSYQRNVVLGLKEVARLVDVVGNELGTRGLTTPFIFSTLALDVSAVAVKRLITAFLKTCTPHPYGEADRQWREEAKFAGPHELGMCLRWGLARVVRIMGGQEVRGLLSQDSYVEWAEAEAALKYPPTHFAAFIAPLDPVLQSLLVGLLTLLTKFTAHSAESGHTPPTLSPLFGPLLFGLGPPTLAFHHVYLQYLRAATAAEHLILSFIRWQDAPGRTANALGVPTRLKAWIKGYPSMLPDINPNERPQPRRGARTTRVVSVRRNVRMYSADLVKTAAGWGVRPRGIPASSMSDRCFAGSREWERICPATLKLPPRYSDTYRKRMDLPSNFHPDLGGSSSSLNSPPSLSSSTSTSSTTSSFFDEKEPGLLGTAEDRFRSLTDLKWGEFEVMGFGSVGADDKKLQFDLTEGARAARAAKRATLSWQDFSSAGFSRNDAPLSATLQFSPPVANTINQWPSQSVELHKKLKKAQKALPSFGWDTEPVIGSEEVIEEAFVDVFCDLVYGGGWLDVERVEETDRECNWALIEFKSVPVAKAHTTSGTADPRTSTSLILFEEFVPLEYRQQLHTGGPTRRRLPSLFGTASRKQWKPAPTLNGRPYVVGHVPHSPSYREVEFEGLLRSNGSATKILSLKTPDRQPLQKTTILTPIESAANSPVHVQPKPNLFLTPSRTSDTPPLLRTSSRGSDLNEQGRSTPVQDSRRRSRFLSPVSPKTSGLQPAEYEEVDFEARLASVDDGDDSLAGKSRHRRRHSKDDAWVDILVASNSRRLNTQSAELRNGLKGGRSDPELASQEVSEVLAAVRGHLSDDDDESLEPVHDMLAYDEDDHRDHVSVSTTDDRETVSASHSNIDEEDEVVITPPRRKLGYFDLHPDRRPSNNALDVAAMPAPQLRVDPPEDDPARPSMESDRSAYDEVYEAIESPRRHSPVQPAADAPRSISPAFNGIRGLPSSPSPREQNPPIIVPSAAAPAPSKTASLIEMYRERERSGAGVVPASKLPVRTGASSNKLPLKLGAAAPTPAVRSPSPSDISIDEDLGEPLDPPGPLQTVAGTVTPPRYVHGAPLHNVLEEEEEEEA